MASQSENSSKKPTHSAYILKAKPNSEQSDWIKVGAAWEHGDKDGMNLSLAVLGQDIPIVIRQNKPKPI